MQYIVIENGSITQFESVVSETNDDNQVNTEPDTTNYKIFPAILVLYERVTDGAYTVSTVRSDTLQNVYFVTLRCLS
jgi:hypothetical protein